MKHDPTCQCIACTDGIEELERREKKALEENGFFFHYVFGTDDEPLPSGLAIDIHTHGFAETLDHPDLQITFPVSPETANNIMWTFARRIKAGEKFKAGDLLEKIIKEPYKVLLVDAIEGDRPVLRVIFPDADGNLSQDTISETFAVQYRGL